MNKISIRPFVKKACAKFPVPGSKSITNRALLLAAMSDYPVKIIRPLHSRDSRIMIDCLKSLGYEISEDAKGLSISGECAQDASLFVGNAGTAARFITAFVCSRLKGTYKFDSDPAMYKRPMGGLIAALEAQGAKFTFAYEKNCFPFTVKTQGLFGGEILVDASESSQILSAILMAAPMAKTDTIVRLKGDTVSKPFVDMTIAMMRKFGYVCETLPDNSYKIAHGVTVTPHKYEIEADATAASYPIALAAAVGGAVLIENFPFGGLQGDVKFADKLEEAGFIKTAKVGTSLLVTAVEKSAKKFSEAFNFNDISDTFLTLAALAAVTESELEICGIAHTRKQETDRVAAMAAELKKIAKKAEAHSDSIKIGSFNFAEIKNKISVPVQIETYDDHRIAMSFGICACADALGNGKPWLEILNPETTAKTFPEFFDVLEQARVDSEKFKIIAIDGGAAVGKSSVSRECSSTLNYMHVDTGSHYRTLAYILLSQGISSEDSETKIAAALKGLKLSTYLEGNTARMGIGSEKIKDSDIRNDKVNENVSVFAAMPAVREFLKSYQRSMAEEAKRLNFGGLVMEGRDIGSVIFPNADLKIFLNADEETRLLRRSKEGIGDSIAKRDKLDKTRKTAPLVCEKDAKRIDTSHMTKEQVVAKALSYIISA